MPLIDHTYFIGELNIPNVNEVQENILYFINKYEDKFLNDLLGETLYTQFKLGLELQPIPAEWVMLRNAIINADLKTSPIANYVYYFWQRNEVTQSTGIGEVITKSENSVRVSPANKVRSAWSEMVDRNWRIVKFIEDNLNVYSAWDRNNIYIFDQYTGWRLKDVLCNLPYL